MTFFNCIIILFFELLIIIFCQQIPIWKLEDSSIDLLSSSDSYNYIMYDERNKGIHIKLEKYIWKENGKIYHKNYIQKNDEEKKEIEFDDIYKFINLEFRKYICPKGKNYLFEYSSNELKEIKYPDNGIIDNWFFNCDYYHNKIMISYLGSLDQNIYALNQFTNNWENYKFQIFQENYGFQDIIYFKYYDVIWPNEGKDHGVLLILDVEGIQVAKIKCLFNYNINRIIIEKKKLLLNMNEKKRNSSAFFDEDKYLYWITYDDNQLLSGFSKTPIQNDIEYLEPDNIEVQTSNSPFESMGNVIIKNINFIRNTKYIYYQIELNSENYYGVIDINKNKILFNTKEAIIEFKPLTKYTLLAITESSAYEICINGKYNGKCRDKCPRGQYLIINENGNYCDGNEECEILLIPDNTCIGSCDEQYYIKNGKECGLCKNINKAFPYKIINETNCINEKPNNTYFTDEKSYILKYCHYSCENCFGDNEYECITCKNSFFKNNGKCDSNCPEHHYKNLKEKICSECDSNCKECDNGKENNNSHCLSCEDGKYLVIAKGFDHNCVEECPNNTKINYDKKQCFSENDDKNNKSNNSNNNSNNNNSSNRVWVWVIIISIIIIIIIIIAIVIFKKYYKNKNEDDVTLVLKSQDDFATNQNESISQDWSVY